MLAALGASMLSFSFLPNAFAFRPSNGQGGNSGLRDGFPCKRCTTDIPKKSFESNKPMAVLLALHGDHGDAMQMLNAWLSSTSKAGVILVALRCPVELACPPAASWWQWYQTPGHSEKWLGEQIDKVTAEYNVDLDKVYATGFSGGASYLGYYIPTHADRFAAVAYTAGGHRYIENCPSCKIPTYFTIGSTDGMIEPFVKPLWRYFDECGGHEMVWDELPAIGHVAMLGALRTGHGDRVLKWLLDRDNQCVSKPVPQASASTVTSAKPVMSSAAPIESAPPQGDVRPQNDSQSNGASAVKLPPYRACGCSVDSISTLGGVAALAALFTITARSNRRKR